MAGIFVLALGDRSQKIERDNRARNSRECPFCAEPVLRNAKVCKHCGGDLVPIVLESDIPATPASSHNITPDAVLLFALVATAAIGALVYFSSTPDTPKPVTKASETTAAADSVGAFTPANPVSKVASPQIPLPRPKPKNPVSQN